MDFPLCGEEVLTIRKKELEKMSSKKKSNNFRSCSIELQESEYIPGNLSCYANLCYDGNKYGNLKLEMVFVSYTKEKFCANIAFYVKSANFSIKCTKVMELKTLGMMYEGVPEDYVDKWSGVFCSLADVLNPKKHFIENGELIIHIHAMAFVEDYPKRIHPTLGSYLWERDDRDFVISVGKNGETKTDIKIHKLILASRSPVFDRMLQTNMKEKAENKLEIIDFDAEVVQSAVEFFYDQANFTTKDFNTLYGLFQFSDIYVIKDLKDKVAHALMFHIFPDTICQIANASLIFNSPDLKKFCVSSLTEFKKKKILISNAEALEEEIENQIEVSDDDDSDEEVIVSDDD